MTNELALLGMLMSKSESETDSFIKIILSAIKNGFYYKQGNEIKHTKQQCSITYQNNKFIICSQYEFDDDLRNYSKTFALTKEELINE